MLLKFTIKKIKIALVSACIQSAHNHISMLLLAPINGHQHWFKKQLSLITFRLEEISSYFVTERFLLQSNQEGLKRMVLLGKEKASYGQSLHFWKGEASINAECLLAHNKRGARMGSGQEGFLVVAQTVFQTNLFLTKNSLSSMMQGWPRGRDFPQEKWRKTYKFFSYLRKGK